jgi:L-fucose isomerase
MTFARLTRLSGRYRMHILRGGFEEFDDATTDRLVRASTREWPHAFARFTASAAEFLTRFSANHIHAVPGDQTDGLLAVCDLLDIDADVIGEIR